MAFNNGLMFSNASSSVVTTVGASYNNSSGQSVANSTATTITGWTQENDSHNAMNTGTGTYTIPVSGRYSISASIKGSTSATATVDDIYILKNGSIIKKAGINQTFTNLDVLNPIQINTQAYSFLIGDTVTIQSFQNSGSSRTLDTDATFNSFSIARIGS